MQAPVGKHRRHYFWPMLFNPGALVFDIGAHVGESADRLINQYGAGRVISVEPCYENYAALRERWLGDDRVVPVHAGLWSLPCIMGVSRSTAQSGLSTMQADKWISIYPDIALASAEEVPCVTLDVLIGRYGLPDYIKVDVEGSEKDVLNGLSTRVSALSFEFHGSLLGDMEACLAILVKLGFTRAEYVTDEADPNTTPARTFADVWAEIHENNVPWGNITVV